MIEVHDDRRILRFEGEEIGFSTSERPGAGRWIEFTLYRTQGDGQYVLSRVGVSNVVHDIGCRMAKGKIQPVPASTLEKDLVGCKECQPDLEAEMLCPETDKTWGRAYKTAPALISGLMKHDESGTLYLTAVAKRLLDEASFNDPIIAHSAMVETIS